MTAIELLLPDGRPSGVYACSACRTVGHEQAWVEGCCTCTGCGQVPENRRTSRMCDACDRQDRARRDALRLEQAEKLEDWDGWVWDENRYYSSLDEFVEFLECSDEHPDEWPTWVYVAEPDPLPHLKIDRILENLVDGWGWDDIEPERDLRGVPDLSAALAAFNEANKEVVSYSRDWSRAVRVPRPAAEPPCIGGRRIP
jgi:hypothetical protein